jgi:hypothetical protein
MTTDASTTTPTVASKSSPSGIPAWTIKSASKREFRPFRPINRPKPRNNRGKDTGERSTKPEARALTVRARARILNARRRSDML